MSRRSRRHESSLSRADRARPAGATKSTSRFPTDRLSRELDVVRAFSFDHSDHHRQLESSRPGARGIEQKHAADNFVARLMTVAEHDDVDVLVQQFGSINVCQKNSPVSDGHTNDVVAVGIIVVAADEGDWRDLA